MTSKTLKATAGTAGAALLALTLAGCGSSSNSGKAGSSGGNAGGVVTQQGQGARLSGTYSALDIWGWIPDNLYPSDISEVPNGGYNTGSLVKVNKKNDINTMSCSDLVQNAGAPGFGEEAYLIDQGANSADTQFYGYMVYEWPTAAQAAEFVHELAARFTACGSFTANYNGTSLPVTLSVGPNPSVPAADTLVDLRDKAVNQGKTAVGEFVVAADGNIVLVETDSSATGTLPTAVSLSQLSQTLLSDFAKQEAQWVSGHVPSDYTTSTAVTGAPSVPADAIGGGVR